MGVKDTEHKKKFIEKTNKTYKEHVFLIGSSYLKLMKYNFYRTHTCTVFIVFKSP